jgi:hypothetical protein
MRYGNWRDETTANIKEVTYLDNPDIKRFDFPFAPLLKIAFDEYLNLTRIKN